MKRFALIHKLEDGFFPNYGNIEVLAIDADSAAYIFGIMIEELSVFGMFEIYEPIEFESLNNEN